MLVSEILRKKKGSAITVRPNDSIEKVVAMFRDEKIGAVMVCKPVRELVGIVTERDVLHSMAEHGVETLRHNAEEVMSHAYTCDFDDNVKTVMRDMTFKHVRHLPVLGNGELVGIISIGDIVKNQLDEAQLEISTMRDFARAH